MTRRTPRRRISPRTKRRYQAIKVFLRRAIGTFSQPDIKTNSSIEVSVSDLKNKIVGIEQELNKVSRHCRDLACLEHSFRKEKDNVSPTQLQQGEEIVIKPNESNTSYREIETKLLYKTSQSLYDSDNVINNQRRENNNTMTSTNRDIFELKPEKIKSRHRFHENNQPNLLYRNQSMQPKFDKPVPIFSASSCHSLLESRNNPGYSGHRHERKHLSKYKEPMLGFENLKDRNGKFRYNRYDDDRHDQKMTKYYSELDKEFITDIIKRQYKPVKLYGRKNSNFSQFSAPVCRDQEFTIRDEIQEGSELCSCCFEGHRKHKHHYICNADLNDMRSICDTHLYSSKKRKRNKYTKHYLNDYNDSTFYDVVPVKERSSPKSRKKFAENNMNAFQYYKEVPPSPKTHKPRFNLKVQRYTDYENSSLHRMQKKTPLHENQRKVANITESDRSSDLYKKTPNIVNNLKRQKPTRIQEDIGTTSSLQCPTFVNEQINVSNNDTTLNTQVTNSTTDKTDKTLCEIKDILQSFLQEIKKESTHSDQSDVTNKVEDKQVTKHQESIRINTSIMPNSGHNFNNYTLNPCGVTPFLQAFPNQCCCPVLPLCPMNGLQNGYIVPSSSYICNVCAKNSKEPSCPDQVNHNNKSKTCEETNINDETQELIKEIYKFVSQKSKSPRMKEEYGNDNIIDNRKTEDRRYNKKFLRTISVGDSVKASKHDANVGTPTMKCYSKSCEAIGIRNTSDTYNTTNGSYSDTILEKLSLEPSHSSSGSDISTIVPKEKIQSSKFKNVFHKLRLFKKKKKESIEEQNESETTVEVDMQQKHPFKQHITNYAMYDQEYFHPPPIPEHCFRHPSELYRYNYELRCQQPPSPPNCCDLKHHYHKHSATPCFNPAKYATAPPYPQYDPHYNQTPSQMPLCFKEIEVKSIGTQSNRKVSILQKITKKIQPQVQQNEDQRNNLPPTKEKPNFWKTLQEKAKQNNPDPMDFSLKTQKQLAHGDIKLRKAMLKKLFYKRNPFSPRNLIVRTLLGKDKSSYGDPPKIYRPRMFL